MKVLKRIILYTLLALGALIMVFPFFWMLLSSVKTAAEVNTMPPTFWPAEPVFENYTFAFSKAPFGIYFVNSVIVTVACVATTMFTTILAAFAFSRLKFPGRDLLFSLTLSMMMVPFEMLIITNYSTIVKMGLIDTLAALIIPFTTSIFTHTSCATSFICARQPVLLCACGRRRQLDLPVAHHVPIAKPALVTIGLLNAITCWNSFCGRYWLPTAPRCARFRLACMPS